MKLSRLVIAGIAATVASGCANSQFNAPHGAPSTASSGIRASSTALCPANANGSGILPDGDFSQASDPGNSFLESGKPVAFAPNWKVERRTIDLYGSTAWDADGLDGYCSVDLDGEESGGIASSPFATKKGTMYYVSFLFSGNGGEYGPTIKELEVKAAGQLAQMQWDTTNGNDAQNGKYETANWQFTARGSATVLGFSSLDYKQSRSGPVIAAISVRTSSPANVRP